MSQTLQIIIPYLQLAAGPASGVIASWMVDRLRAAYPYQHAGTFYASLLYAPRYVRLFSLLLAALVAVCASVLVALLSSGDLPAALDTALAAALAGVASQLTHAAQLPPDVPPPAPVAIPVAVGVRLDDAPLPGVPPVVHPLERRSGSRSPHVRNTFADPPEETNS